MFILLALSTYSEDIYSVAQYFESTFLSYTLTKFGIYIRFKILHLAALVAYQMMVLTEQYRGLAQNSSGIL
jgi:hypothetical protein